MWEDETELERDRGSVVLSAADVRDAVLLALNVKGILARILDLLSENIVEEDLSETVREACDSVFAEGEEILSKFTNRSLIDRLPDSWLVVPSEVKSADVSGLRLE